MTAYDLPTSLTIGEVVYPIRYGWRAVMDIFSALNDPELDSDMKLEAVLTILYPDFSKIPRDHLGEAIEKAFRFIDCGQKPGSNRPVRTMDWEQDAPIIVPEINKVARTEVRADPNIHWWTFFGWYMAIDGGVFSTVLHIRQKRAKHKKLEKWEEDFLRENRELVELSTRDTEEVQREKESILKFLNG